MQLVKTNVARVSTNVVRLKANSATSLMLIVTTNVVRMRTYC